MEERLNQEQAAKKKKKRKRFKPRFFIIIGLFILIAALLVWGIVKVVNDVVPEIKTRIEEANATPVPTPSPTPTPAPTATPIPYATPRAVSGKTDPDTYGMVSHIEENGEEVTTFTRAEPISFVSADAYNKPDGVLCFRGNSARDTASFGTANLTEYALTEYAHATVGALKKGSSASGNWSGCGWTGQPLIVRWTDEVRRCMTNLYEEARNKTGLTEVIYPAEDGCIYFFDLETGKPTRDTLSLHMPFKGTGCVDPRGWPLLYVGTGDEYEADNQKARAMIISLIDGTKLYEFGIQDTDSFAKRNWYSYDSAPLIDATTDTLIWPGENGVVYTMKLNTVFSAENRVLSVSPENTVKFRYDSNRSYTDIDLEDSAHKWLGYEGSASVWRGYLYLSSNDGLLQCLDLNTMTLKWVADTLDDTNASPVLEILSDEEAYLYVGTSLHFTKDGNNTGKTPFFKINALTGETVESYTLTCETVSGVSGGIQGTAALGKNNLSDLVYVPFARYNGKQTGLLVALDKTTFEPVWKYEMQDYSWSSPVIVYDDKGDGVVIEADSGGYITMLDGRTGEVKCRIRPTETTFEASPAVFDDKLVIGCRGGQTIFFLRLS